MTTATTRGRKRFFILVTCDEESSFAGVTADLQRAGLPPDVEATVLSVADLLPLPASSGSAALPELAARAQARVAQGIATALRHAEAAAAQLRAAFPGWAVTVQAQADAPAWGIIKLADQVHPDLIVVGAHEHSLLGRLLLGSTSLAVLTHASTSVRIARPSTSAAGAAPRVLVGVDGSAGADAAIAAVAARGWKPPAQVRVVAALDPSLAASLELSEMGDIAIAGQHLVERGAAALRAAGFDVSTAVVDGAPKYVLVDEAQQWQADCILLGARGLRATERFLLGSVSSSVAARAHCSVEVVRPAASR